jgi:RHS repeat-associated protein
MRNNQITNSDKNTLRSGFAQPVELSLPKGGGAIRGIDEKFSINPTTGTASLNIPIFTSPSRHDFYPQLNLSYDSGAGNGPFGLGWNLAIPVITRKTDKGLPRYLDGDDDNSDTFIFAGAEDLVPQLVQSGGEWQQEALPVRVINGIEYSVQRYRPRTEGLFARIERWTNQQNGEVHWRTISKDNITTLYGYRVDARIADPTAPSRIFSWLICESYDDKGNAILYQYQAENAAKVDPLLPQERNRLQRPYAQRYLKRIKYGNHSLRQTNEDLTLRNDWLFEVVFDYDEGHYQPLPPNSSDQQLVSADIDPQHDWSVRADPFSSYRAGFEIRTQRLCQRVLMFHHFTELGETPCLIRSTEFSYQQNAVLTYLTSTTQYGFKRDVRIGIYTCKGFPPTEFSYTQPQLKNTVGNIDAKSQENLPIGLHSSQYQWLDLDGEGIAGIVTEQAEGWFYKCNLGNGRFGPMQQISTQPSLGDLQGGQARFMDLAGDGRKDVVLLDEPLAGFFERSKDSGWNEFIPFSLVPKVDWRDPNLRLVDLNGDGHADILITADEVFTWYPSKGEAGFGPCEQVPKSLDEETGPALVFADQTQSIYLADMSGDSLSDLVRIQNGAVCYWPNLGYGHFGAKVTMAAAPVFDTPDLFNQQRIQLADIDGSGTTDILYLGWNTVSIWSNQAGNAWSEPQCLNGFPLADRLSSVAVVDLLGNGTTCLVWSSPLLGDQTAPLRYIDLMGGVKPHLMQAIIDNMGTETRFQYTSSNQFYLQDLAAGKPWITKLPFPVPVVERIETRELVTGSKLVTRYQYHHGYFDGQDREFRGFGMVEQWDTESFEVFNQAGLFSELPNVPEPDLHLPPVYTKTWFHTGFYQDRQHISQQYTKEYYQGDVEAVLLPDSILPPGLNAQERHEACRALKGSILRQEIYALDDSPESAHPYSVSERNYGLKLIQPPASNRFAVFYAYARETLDYHYERAPHDPRINHALTLAIDDFGHVTQSAAIVYPRRVPGYDEQARLLCIYNESDVINMPDDNEFYLLGVPYQSSSFEVTGLTLNQAIGSLDEVRNAIATAAEIPYEAEATTGVLQKRLIERERTLYYRNDLTAALPLGQAESLALPYESYQMAFTPGLLTQIYGAKIDYASLATILTTEGRFQHWDGAWWDPSGRPVYAPQSFYLPIQIIEPFDNTYITDYDDYALLVTRTEDPLQNSETAENDYRVLQPWLITDANRNRSAIQVDELGMVIATAEMGKTGLNQGDTLANPTTQLEYELFNWMHHKKPNFVHTYVREQHGSVNPRWQEAYSYSDGLGREISTKIQAEPGLTPARDNDGNLLRDLNGDLVWVDTSPQIRWVGTGRKVFDNKGNPIKQYEPFFSSTYEYEDKIDLIEWGVTPILRYDPLGRLVRTDNPNGTFSKVVFNPWQQTSFDENDTVTESDWYAKRMNLSSDDPQQRAAELTVAHANTPTTTYLDTLGRAFLTIADNGSLGQYSTHTELDIEGNPRKITDARGNPIMQYAYGMIGPVEEEEEEENNDEADEHLLYQNSMDAGERWLLYNVAGNPVRRWDSRGHIIRYQYDALQRQTHVYVQPENDSEFLAEHIIYGEDHSNAIGRNLRDQIYQHYDSAGVITNEEFDFKDNLLRNTRQLVSDYTTTPDWSQSPNLETEIFTTIIAYDALNRPTEFTTPDASIYRPGYNEANLLNTVVVNLRGAFTSTRFINNIDYNAKGQREQINYANGVVTTYTYEPDTFRLSTLTSIRQSDGKRIQDLSYVYDPVGNVMMIQDDAQQTLLFNNTVVEPHSHYQYDALYRLIKADGREYAGQGANDPHGHADIPYQTIPQSNNSQLLRNYTEEFSYDAVGNILKMVHRLGGSSNPSQAVWERRYQYATVNNRLLSTSRPSDPMLPDYSDTQPYSDSYNYDAHGNMLSMPHLSTMQWNYADKLQASSQASSRQVGGTGAIPEITWYSYTANGQRIREVIESSIAATNITIRNKERIYLNGYEIYREYQNDGSSIKLAHESLHVIDDDHRIALVETKTIDVDIPSHVPTPITRYQLNNHLKSSSLELSNSGAVISYEEYYPYGSTSYHASDGNVEVSWKRYRYTGKEKDEETGMYYHGARYYIPWLGRWISVDPIGPQSNQTQYTYANNNPLFFIDMTGKQSDTFEDIDNKMPDINIENFTKELTSIFAEAHRQNLIEKQKKIEAFKKWVKKHPKLYRKMLIERLRKKIRQEFYHNFYKRQLNIAIQRTPLDVPIFTPTHSTYEERIHTSRDLESSKYRVRESINAYIPLPEAYYKTRKYLAFVEQASLITPKRAAIALGIYTAIGFSPFAWPVFKFAGKPVATVGLRSLRRADKIYTSTRNVIYAHPYETVSVIEAGQSLIQNLIDLPPGAGPPSTSFTPWGEAVDIAWDILKD